MGTKEADGAGPGRHKPGGWLMAVVGMGRETLEGRSMKPEAKAVAISSVFWLLPLLLLVPWVFDRHPPFEVLSVEPVQPTKPGDQVTTIKTVRRDLARSCDVRLSRFFIDAKGTLFIFDEADVSNMINRKIAEKSHDQARSAVTVPIGAAAGVGSAVTERYYYCNPLHRLWPIRVSDHVEIPVLPK